MEQICLLPAGEVLPAMTPGGSTALAEKLEAMAGKLSNKKRSGSDELIGRLKADAELLRQNALRGGLDRYMAAIYEERAIPLELSLIHI